MRRKYSSTGSRRILTAVFALAMMFSAGLIPAAGANEHSNIVKADEREKLYQFTLDGKTYQLPCKLSDLEKDGWSIGAYDKNYKFPGLTIDRERLSKGDQSISIQIYNDSGDAIPKKDCKVGKLDISSDRVKFKNGKGIEIGDSLSQVKSKHGKETAEEGNRDNPTCLTYKYRLQSEIEEKTAGIKIVTLTEEANENSIYYEFKKKKVSRIACTYYKLPSDLKVYDGSVTYMKNYKAPDSLGNSLASFNYSIGGSTFHFPTPAAEFASKGFKLEGAVPGLSSRSLPIKKDGKSMNLYLGNDDTHYMSVKNTYAKQIHDYGDGGALSLILPGNIKTGTKRAELLKVCPEFKQAETKKAEKNGVTYSCDKSSGKMEYHIRDSKQNSITITTKDDKITDISLFASNWN